MKFVISFFLLLATSTTCYSQKLTLFDAAMSEWIIRHPEEIVSYFLFDTSSVRDKLPDYLEFMTIQDLALDKITWAELYVSENPKNKNMGLSFLEIVKPDTFIIDDKILKLDANEALAVWFARVKHSAKMDLLIKGKSYLVLEFFSPG